MAQNTGGSTAGTGDGKPWTSPQDRTAQDRTVEPGLMGRMRERATATIETQKDRALDGVDSVTQAVRGSTQRLRDSNRETIAGYVEQVADQIDRLAARLREKEVAEF